MSAEEILKINAFCAEFVMRWKLADNLLECNPGEFWLDERGRTWTRYGMQSGAYQFEPTTSPADAFAVLKECAIKMNGNIVITKDDDSIKWFCGNEAILPDEELEGAEAETLELAICLFCKSLYEKENA